MKKNYYAIIPANVRYDKNLTDGAKLLYGEITALCNQEGYSWARDSYFAELYQVSRSTIQRWFNQLEKNGHIRREVKYREGTLKIEHRYTYICDNPMRKNETTPTPKNETVNNTVINNTSNNTSNKDSHVRDIFNHYLSKNLVKHRKITSDMYSAINTRLKERSFEELIQVIDNYAIVFHGSEYWFDTKYTLADLMRPKDVRKFLDESDPLSNYRKRGMNNGFQGPGNSNARGNGAGTSYEQALQDAKRAREYYRGGM